MSTNKSIHKLLNWEHWPTSMFYLPNLPYAFYLAFKAKHTAFFTATNPCIKSSGNGTESKFKTIQLVPKKYRPKSILICPNSDFNDVLSQIKENDITFPLIVKPDIGFRGLLVQKIKSEKDLKFYLSSYPIDIIIQEFLDYDNECGIFYHRNPNHKKGKISSITLKRFSVVNGDGISTLKELILKDERAKLYINLFKNIHQEKMNMIPLKNKKIELTAIGNHSKGTQFINGNYLISKKLEETFDTFCNLIPDLFYARIDLKYNDFKELENGINFKILEVNGILAEPTHIYDAESYSYFKALKSIRTHWRFIYEISTANHRDYKVPYKSSRKFINEMFELKAYTKKIAKLSKD